jgi:hypothetical protein
MKDLPSAPWCKQDDKRIKYLLYIQAINQGGLTKTLYYSHSTLNNINFVNMVAYRYHSGRVHNYVSDAPREQRHLPGKRGSQIGLPPSPHAFHP